MTDSERKRYGKKQTFNFQKRALTLKSQSFGASTTWVTFGKKDEEGQIRRGARTRGNVLSRRKESVEENPIGRAQTGRFL